MRRHPARLTEEEAHRLSEAQETVELVVHPALLPGLLAWLNGRGLDMVPGPGDVARLPWYFVSPMDWTD